MIKLILNAKVPSIKYRVTKVKDRVNRNYNYTFVYNI